MSAGFVVCARLPTKVVLYVKSGKDMRVRVTDNPSIDWSVEDLYLGDELYYLIMAKILRRMENRCKGDK